LVDRAQKAEGYLRAFREFDPEKVARYTENRIEKLTLNPAIIRNRIKIKAAARNAQAFLAIQEEVGGLDVYCWRFVDARCNHRFPQHPPPLDAIVASTNATISTRLSAGSHFIDSRILFDSGAHRVNT
jgi:DNA-3-methyladenine glycosylase I